MILTSLPRDQGKNVRKMGSSLFRYDVLSRLTGAEVPLVADTCTSTGTSSFFSPSREASSNPRRSGGEITTGPRVRIAPNPDAIFLANAGTSHLSAQLFRL